VSTPKRIVGIDLGTTYSAIAYITEDGRPEIIRTLQDARNTPSVVFVDGGEAVVGEAAKEQATAFPDRVVAMAKRHMGTTTSFSVDGKEYSPETISGFILKKLKEDAERVFGELVTEAVITVPAYFGVGERKATEDAGVIAGLSVRHILSEPTAAAIAFGMTNAKTARTLLVYDLGGGTFDVTILKVKPTDGKVPDIEVLSCGGDHRLGGADWDRAMVDHVAKVFREKHNSDPSVDEGVMRDLMMKCERAKQTLATASTATVVCTFAGKTIRVQFDRTVLHELTQPLLNRTRELMDDLLAAKQMSQDQIDEVLLVGGSTKLVMVREMLEGKFGKDRLNGSVHPDLCVAEGAAWYAHLLAKASHTPNPVSDALQPDGVGTRKTPATGLASIKDVCPFALGTAILASARNENILIDTIIHKDQKLPCDETARYSTVEADQTGVTIDVYENESRTKGEKYDPELSKLIASVTLDGLPPGRPGGQPIQVTFRLDDGFRLKVIGIDIATGKTVEADIDYASAMNKGQRDAAQRTVSETRIQS
jgi:molecular chaperone DnaK